MFSATRVHHQTILVESVVDAIVTTVAVSDQASFTNLTVKAWVFATAQTPTVTITQTAPGVGQLQVRVRGYGPREEYIEEITPLVGVVAKTTNHIYLGSLFKKVTEVAYIASGMTIGAMIGVGCVNDLARANSGTVQHIAPGNLGFWVPGQRSSRMDPPFSLGETCDPNEPEVRYCHGRNLTTTRGWLMLPGAEIVGFSESGWAVSDDKIGFDFSKFEDAFGGAATQLLTHVVEIYVATESDLG